jgi:hypothetical protein
MSVPTDQETATRETDAPAIRLDLDSAFSTGDDSDTEEFDIKAATAHFRARLAEQDASLRHEDEDIEHDKPELESDAWGPQLVLRRSADVETEVSGPPISPFVATPQEETLSPPLGPKDPSIIVNEAQSDDQDQELPFPAREDDTTSNHDEDPDIPTQKFEDVSLEEEPTTPNTARSTGSPAPRVPSVSSRPGSAGGTQIVDRAPWSPPEAHGVKTTSFQDNFKPSRKTGTSALQKVISKTRPTHLPPKPREEDIKHLKVWEDMMKKSRQAGEIPDD